MMDGWHYTAPPNTDLDANDSMWHSLANDSSIL